MRNSWFVRGGGLVRCILRAILRGKCCVFFCGAFFWKLPPFLFQSSILLSFFLGGFRERTLDKLLPLCGVGWGVAFWFVRT